MHRRNVSVRGESGMNKADYKVGQIIHFGTYRQSVEGGLEPIEWQVLYSYMNEILLISRYALDCVQYNDKYGSINWGVSSLRHWMNTVFWNTAFSPEEQAQMSVFDALRTRRFMSLRMKYNRNLDRVCILSIEEAEVWLPSPKDRICQATEYAKHMGVRTYESNRCRWWLRSPLRTHPFASCVTEYGGIEYRGNAVDAAQIGVRPVIAVCFSDDNSIDAMHMAHR